MVFLVAFFYFVSHVLFLECFKSDREAYKTLGKILYPEQPLKKIMLMIPKKTKNQNTSGRYFTN